MDWITHLVDEPLANLIILAGLAFLGIGVVGKIGGYIDIDPDRTGRVLAGVVGLALIPWGVNVHIKSDAASTAARQSPEPQAIALTLPTPPQPSGSASGEPDAQYIPAFYSWQPASNGYSPPGAVIGGYEKVQFKPGKTYGSYEGQKPLYVCRALFQGGTYTGKIVGTNCNIGVNGTENLMPNYEVLTAQPGKYTLDWERAGSAPANAIVGGRAGQELYLCQVPYQGGLHPGWVAPAPQDNTCTIGYGGVAIPLPGFSYLIPIKGQPGD